MKKVINNKTVRYAAYMAVLVCAAALICYSSFFGIKHFAADSIDDYKNFRNQTQSADNDESVMASSKSIAASSAESAYQIMADEKELLARFICAEADSEPYYAKVSCAAVIINRIKNGGFGNSVKEAIYSDSFFKSVKEDSIDAEYSEKKLNTARDAVDAAAKGIDPTGGALYFAKIGDENYTIPIMYECGRMIYGR